MKIETIAHPATMPVSVTDLKNWIRRDPVEEIEDTLYAQAIRGATDDFESQANRRIVLQRVRWLPRRFGDQDPTKWPGCVMRVPLGNTGKDTLTINYTDRDGVTSAFTDFTVNHSDASWSEIVLDRGAKWPTDVDTKSKYPIQIEFDCGWPTGDEWTADTDYTNEIVIPTFLAQTGTAYEVSVAGTSGATEPTWTTETGATQAEGPDTLVWECIGATIPGDIKTAILARAQEKCVSSGLLLSGDRPNYNLIHLNWQEQIFAWGL